MTEPTADPKPAKLDLEGMAPKALAKLRDEADATLKAKQNLNELDHAWRAAGASAGLDLERVRVLTVWQFLLGCAHNKIRLVGLPRLPEMTKVTAWNRTTGEELQPPVRPLSQKTVDRIARGVERNDFANALHGKPNRPGVDLRLIGVAIKFCSTCNRPERGHPYAQTRDDEACATFNDSQGIREQRYSVGPDPSTEGRSWTPEMRAARESVADEGVVGLGCIGHGWEKRGFGYTCVEGGSCGLHVQPGDPEYELIDAEEHEARRREEGVAPCTHPVESRKPPIDPKKYREATGLPFCGRCGATV